MALLWAAPLSAAAGLEDLSGTIIANTVSCPGPSASGLEGFRALHAYGTNQTLAYDSLKLRAERLVLNATHRRWDSWFQNPNRPNESLVAAPPVTDYAEVESLGASVEVDRALPEANLLVVAQSPSSTGDLRFAQPVRWSTSPEETWWGGDYLPGTQAVQGNPLARLESFPAGFLKGQAEGVAHVSLSGDFTLYLWGANATLVHANGTTQRFRTGTWVEDSSPSLPGYEVKREKHGQFVRLEVHNGTLVGRVTDGRWLAQGAHLDAESLVQFERAAVDLESKTHAYQSSESDVTLVGAVRAEMAPRPDSTVESRIQASAARLDGQPGTRREIARPSEPAAGAGLPQRPAPAGVLEANLDSDPSLAAPVLATLAVLTAGLLVLAIHRRRRAARDWLEEARSSLRSGDPGGAIQAARRVLDVDRSNVGAWFVLGAALLRRNEYDRTIGLLEPVLARMDPQVSGLAFLVALSYVRAGNPAGARRWLPMVARDSALWKGLGEETDFGLLLGSLLRDPKGESAAQDPAYG